MSQLLNSYKSRFVYAKCVNEVDSVYIQNEIITVALGPKRGVGQRLLRRGLAGASRAAFCK